MGQRNMVYTGPMIDAEREHARLLPEPSVVPYGQIMTFRHPNDHLPPPGNFHGPLPTGITQYNGVDYFMPAHPGLQNQLPFPSNQVMDGYVAIKDKIAGGFPVNFQYYYPAPAPAPGLNSIVVPEYRSGFPVNVQYFYPPGIPYFQGYANGYQVMTMNGNPVAYMHPPMASLPPPPPMPPLRGTHNVGFHPQPASTSRMVPFQNGVGFVGPTPPVGVRVFHPRRQEVMIESTSRHRGFPPFRVLPQDGVAMIDISNYGRRVDHHRDMRLDIDHMSYEELLALGERIGNAGSSLSDDFILVHLKTRTFTPSRPEDGSSADQETNFCTICQMEYEDEEKIGMLDCRHEYHVDCIKRWLIVKNSCPVCKCTALATQGNE